MSIAEDFQPPEDWVPGQTINKDVSAVNTGNVDAFVRMWLEGEMSIMKQVSVGESTAIPDSVSTVGLGFEATDPNDTMAQIGFAFRDKGENPQNYYKVLSKTERANPQLNGTDTAVGDNTYSEVKAVQAGGFLVSAPENAKWTYTAAQQTEITNSQGETEMVAAGTIIGTVGTEAAKIIQGNAPCVIDSDTFTPITPGLYIFRRNITLNGTANNADTYEYSGYVFDGTNYFALCTDKNGNFDYTLPEGAVTVATYSEPQHEPLTYTLVNDKIKLFTATETIVQNKDLSWAYTAPQGDTAAKLTVTYNGGTENEQADDIAIDVTLANIGTGAQQWTAKTADNKLTTFYYNDDLEAGDSSSKLVESVTLSSSTTQNAFLAFDFDLNVYLESVQVTIGEDGHEKTTPVEGQEGQFATAPKAGKQDETDGVGASATAQDAEEIDAITWN